MAPSAKLWAGITMSFIVIAVVVIHRRIDYQRFSPTKQCILFEVRKKITLHLTQLREQYARADEGVYINTFCDIQALWRLRDLYFYTAKDHTPQLSGGQPANP